MWWRRAGSAPLVTRAMGIASSKNLLATLQTGVIDRGHRNRDLGEVELFTIQDDARTVGNPASKAQCGHIAASQTVSRRCHLVWPLTSWQSVASCDLLRTDPCRNWPGLADPLPWQTYGSGVTVTVTPRRWSSSANRRLLRSGYFPVRQVPSASSSAAPVTSASGVPPQAARRSGHARAGRPCAGLGFSGRWC